MVAEPITYSFCNLLKKAGRRTSPCFQHNQTMIRIIFTLLLIVTICCKGLCQPVVKLEIDGKIWDGQSKFHLNKNKTMRLKVISSVDDTLQYYTNELYAYYIYVFNKQRHEALFADGNDDLHNNLNVEGVRVHPVRCHVAECERYHYKEVRKPNVIGYKFVIPSLCTLDEYGWIHPIADSQPQSITIYFDK